MRKQKSKIILFISVFVLINWALSSNALAGASATITWVPPTTDQGGGVLGGGAGNDLAGFKVYYRASVSTWLSTVGTCLLGLGSSVNIADPTATKYTFVDSLIPGTTYYFTVVAFDDSNNLSYCGKVGTSGAQEVSKRVTYSADLDSDKAVGIFDYNILKNAFGTVSSAADVDRSGGVIGIFDYNMLKGQFGLSFI